MKISVVTAVLNRHETIGQAIQSVQKQMYSDVEHVIQDGVSTDGTLEIINASLKPETLLLSEPDTGIYDAINKGIQRSSGEIVGLLHSDDFFASSDVLTKVADAFSDPAINCVYSDLHYVSAQDPEKVVRHWVAGSFSATKLKRGWMPPHPTVFLRREVFERLGYYDTSYRIAADYEAMLRLFGSGSMKSIYIPEVLVKMRTGGASNQSLKYIIKKSREDYKALKDNKVGGLGALLLKNASKVSQFIGN